MLHRSHRFHGYNALNFAHKQGKVVRGPAMSLKCAKNTRQKSYRVAVVISKKVAKSAVVRNRIRRRVFEAARLELVHVTQPYDLIFMIYQADLAQLPSDELRKMVARQLRQAGVTTSVTA